MNGDERAELLVNAGNMIRQAFPGADSVGIAIENDLLRAFPVESDPHDSYGVGLRVGVSREIEEDPSNGARELIGLNVLIHVVNDGIEGCPLSISVALGETATHMPDGEVSP